MKKARISGTMDALRTARIRKGWSQQQVATFIDTNRFTVARWERGTAFPSLYFRQKLSELFGVSLEALQLVPGLNGTHPTAIRDGSAQQPASHLLSESVMPPPALLAHGLVGRDAIIQQLIRQLCTPRPGALSALWGLPGIGKTALAIEIAYTKEVLAHFPDGILWIGLGPLPPTLALLGSWAAALGLASADIGYFKSIDALGRALQAMLGTKRILLIIDDAWAIEDALAFKIGGPHCAHLLTTRFPQIAAQFAHGNTLVVEELLEEHGLELLDLLAPEVVSGNREQVLTLVQAVGRLPLALTLMGHALHQQSLSGQPRRIHAMLKLLRQTEERLRLSAPYVSAERSLALPPGTPLSLNAAITVSVKGLPKKTQQILSVLAVFPAKPNSFSEEAARAVCQLPQDILENQLDRLTDAGLLASVAPERYSIHQTIVDYALLQEEDREAMVRMVSYFADYAQRHHANYPALDREVTNLLAALQMAHERQMVVPLTRGICGLATYLFDRGMFETATVHLTRASTYANPAASNHENMAVLFHLGWIAALQGEQKRAEECVQQGLALVEALPDSEYKSAFLHLQGMVCLKRGHIQQAEELCQEAITLARQQQDRKRMMFLLVTIIKVALIKGNMEQGKALAREGLAMALELENMESAYRFLGHIGVFEGIQGNYARAQAAFQQGLDLARQWHLREGISNLLTNLAILAANQADFKQAEVYLQEALVEARQVNHRERICGVLANLGVLLMEQDRDIEAEQFLREGLVLVDEIGHAEQRSSLLCRLGQATLKQKRYYEAEAYVQESIQIAQNMKHTYRLGQAWFTWGKLQAQQLAHQQAREAFTQALSFARSISDQELTADTLFMLAQTDLECNILDEAYAEGQESLTIFNSLGHFRRERVQNWLKQHFE